MRRPHPSCKSRVSRQAIGARTISVQRFGQPISTADLDTLAKITDQLMLSLAVFGLP